MVKKSDLLNNLREYSSDQIVEAINSGVVTIYELSKSGNLTPLMRKRIEQKLADFSKNKEDKKEQLSQLVDESFPIVANEIDKNVEIPLAIPEDVPTEASILEAPDENLSASAKEREENVEIPDEDPIETNISEVPIVSTMVESTTLNETNTEQKDAAFQEKGLLKHPFSFKGRIRRTEYVLSMVIYLICYASIVLVCSSSDTAFTTRLLFFPLVWFLWAQSCKRCHDRGNSGWYQIIPFYFLVLLFGDGDEGTNAFGDNPKN